MSRSPRASKWLYNALADANEILNDSFNVQLFKRTLKTSYAQKDIITEWLDLALADAKSRFVSDQKVIDGTIIGLSNQQNDISHLVALHLDDHIVKNNLTAKKALKNFCINNGLIAYIAISNQPFTINKSAISKCFYYRVEHAWGFIEGIFDGLTDRVIISEINDLEIQLAA